MSTISGSRFHPDSLEGWILLALTILESGLILFAAVDAIRHRPASYIAAGKQTKQRWMIFLGVACIIVLLMLATSQLGPLNPISLIGVVAAGVYLADVRPALRQIEGRGPRGGGPPRGRSDW